MATLVKFFWSLGSENLPLLFIAIGVVMLIWVTVLGDVVIRTFG